MRQILLLPLVMALMLSTVGTARAQEGAPSTPLVEASRQITRDPSPARAHAVPAMAVHPDDPSIIAIAHGEGREALCYLDVSTNGGASWVIRQIELTPAYPKCVYANLGPIADVAFSPDGTLYYVYSGFDPETYHSRLFLLRSSDLGETFETTELPWVEPDLEQGQFGADALPQIAVDPNRPERVYVGWMTNNGTWNLSDEVLGGQRYYYDIFSRPYVASSADGGETFSEPVDVGPPIVEGDESKGSMNEPHLVVGNDGALYAFFGENVRPLPEGSEELAPPAHLWMAKSTDAGETFDTTAIYTRERKSRDWLSGPSPGVDRNTGALYVVWDDQPAPEAMALVAFTRSDDGGETWSEPERLNDVEPQRPWRYCEFCPSLSVSPDGRIDVAWYDWRNDPTFDPEAEEPSNRFQDVYYTYSTDGGSTWSSDIRVTDRLIDRSIGVFSTQGLRGNVGLASTERAALLAWSDTRNGTEETQSQDIYFTKGWPEGRQVLANDDDRSAVAWGFLGAGLALAVGGAALFLGLKWARRPGGAVGGARGATT